ncbi:hypothetical protein L1785_05315 [Antribacter sp. KLBMP9083]|uniref:Uncharacterized protein n=1 Tax=Antribacter soli TaxID=2910976 RepID=A0AA41U8E0_9MICO|nr:hypothetical protein [Antribacter soli]
MPIVLAVCLLALAACAPGVNEAVDVPAPGGERPAGFWLGVWHGFIVLVTFVISLFTDSVSIYEVHNTGGWYDVGFLLGLGVSIGGGYGAGRARS